MKNLFFTFLLLFCLHQSWAQSTSDLSVWETGRSDYKIAGIKIEGTQYVDKDLLIALSGLAIGDKITIPGDEKIAKAIDKLWSNNLFENIEVKIEKVSADYVFIVIAANEVPRLSRTSVKGIKKSDREELKDKIGLTPGRAVTEATLKNASLAITDYFKNKGFNQVAVSFSQEKDVAKENHVILRIEVDKGKKVRIDNISFSGNDNVPESVLKNKLKTIKERMRFSIHPNQSVFVYPKKKVDRSEYWKNFGFMSVSKTLEYLNPYMNLNLFSNAKLAEAKLEESKENIINYYNSIGYRDAEILADTFYYNKTGNLNVEYKISEGKKYYFGNFYWRGNTKYDNKTLNELLAINKGETYNKEALNSRISSAGPDAQNLSSLYQDDGYLFSNIVPIEKSIYNDTIDFELRITEGPQAIIKNIYISGNDKTSDHVIRREIRTMPGNKYSRSDIIRTIRELSNLGYFNPENITPLPKPDYQNGTVDIEYKVEEKSTDKLELSAGFGGNFGLFGTLGVTFNNFSLKNIRHPENWDPLPMGDGQKLNLRVQSNGKQFNSESFSFTEPWLGGKKPTSFSFGINRSFVSYANYNQEGVKPRDVSLTQVGGSIGISKRIKWPDDNFVISYNLNYTNYRLINFKDASGNSYFLNGFENGYSNNLNLSLGLSRYSIDNPLYPRTGSNLSFNLTVTPPFSLLSGKDFSNSTVAQKYHWVEYQKVRVNAEWYQKIAGNLVMKFAGKFGFMGYYNKDIGFSPFERFQVGGDGLSGMGMNWLSRDIIAQRGYTAPYSTQFGDPIFNKYTMELRYPISLNPSSTIYGLAFVEAANSWTNYTSFNPFQLNRTAGMGLRVYLPMFGLLGVDYGLGLDRYYPGSKLRDFANFTFMLGFEPQ